MTPVKQKADSDWCGLACLESASRDAGLDQQKDVSQTKFHEIAGTLKQGDDSKGAMLISLAWAAGLGNCVHSGKGKNFLLKAEPFIYESAVFITTNRNPDTGEYAGHCWRLKAIGEQGFTVMEPSDKIRDEFADKSFDDLERFDCDIWVITKVTDERLR